MGAPIAIFYDLETSDKSPIGQILNYSFIAVDADLHRVSECSGDIRLTRLQLPSPEAILKNRVNVLKHQREVATTEREGMAAISQFVASVIAHPDRKAAKLERTKVSLIGYNSTKFDLPFLRTSLIRNGINPYFGGGLQYRDLLLGVRKLSLSDRRFPRAQAAGTEGEETPRLSLSLETVSHQLNLLTGAQSHHSREDVLLTIKLAKALRERFDFDCLTYDPFEAAAWIKQPSKGGLLWSLAPSYDLSSKEISERVPLALLDANHRYALFINLKRYAAGEGRKSIQWFNQSGGALYVAGPAQAEELVPGENGKGMTLGALAEQARKELEGITLNNFFPISTCDIEQDIYRLDMQRIGTLEKALWGGDTKALSEQKDRDAKVIYLRALLAQYRWQGGAIPSLSPDSEQTSAELQPDNDARMASKFKSYALHRYGGKLQLVKSLGEEPDPEAFHPTLAALLSRLVSCKEEATKNDREEDVELLSALQEFYATSEIAAVTVDELLAEHPALRELMKPPRSSEAKSLRS